VEASIQNLLVDQVKEHLNQLSAKDRVREMIYAYFAPQCVQHEIAEDEFYKDILRPAYKRALPAPEEDHDPMNRNGNSVKIFGESIHSLKRLGSVLFEDPAREKIYFEDVTFLKGHVDSLEDADTAISYTLLYRSEHDTEKRYLKICYRLNPALPYRITGELFGNLDELLTAGFKSRSLMNHIYQDYGHGKLHIWLNTRDPEQFPMIPDEKSVVSFLGFVYQVNNQYPFYIEQELFTTPLELVTKAQQDLSFWEKLSKYSHNGNLFVWFDALGHTDWRMKFQDAATSVQQDDMIDQEGKICAIIQQLLYIIEPEAARPMIEVGKTKIEILNIPATESMEIRVKLSLKTLGFVQVRVALETVLDGISLNKDYTVLFDLNGQTDDEIILVVDPQRLAKNTEHQTVLKISSPYQLICVPIRLMTVFPIRTFVIHMIRYALLGALFFGFFRWFLSVCTGHVGSLAPAIITTSVSRSLPENYQAFFWVIVLLLTTLVLSIVAIKRIEKI
jgi:hypothetical protein